MAPTSWSLRFGRYTDRRLGFAQFIDDKPVNEAVSAACFSCREPAKARDFVFTQYAP
jgi:hypothetical protein